MPGTSPTPPAALDNDARDWIDQALRKAREASETYSPGAARVEQMAEGAELAEAERELREEENAILDAGGDLPDSSEYNEEQAQFEAFSTPLELADGAVEIAEAPVVAGIDNESDVRAPRTVNFGDSVQNAETAVIPEYLSSRTMPAGWQPTPTEMLRLQNTGAFRRRVPDNPEEIWAAGRRQARRNQGMAGSAAQAQGVSDLEADRRARGLPSIEESWRGTNLPIPYLEITNEEVVDTPRRARQLENMFHRQLQLERGHNAPGANPTRQEQRELDRDAEDMAHIALAQSMQAGRTRFFADPHHEDLTAQIAEGNGLWNYVQAYMSPIAYGYRPEDIGDNPTPRQRAAYVSSEMQWRAEHPIWRVGRANVGSAIASTFTAGGRFGGEETVGLIRQGDDLFYHIPEYVGAFHRLLDPEGSEVSTGAVIGGNLGGWAMMIGSPDGITAVLAPLAAAKGAATAYSVIRRTEGLADVLDNLVITGRRVTTKNVPVPAVRDPETGEILREASTQRVETPDVWPSQLATEVGREDLATQHILGIEGAKRLNTHPRGGPGEADRLFRSIDEIRERIARAGQRQRVAEEMLDEAEAAGSLDARVLKQIEDEWELAQLEAEATEIEKILALGMLGVPEDVAKGVTSLADYINTLQPRLIEEANKAIDDAAEARRLAMAAHYNPEKGRVGGPAPGDILDDIRERYLTYLRSQVEAFPSQSRMPRPSTTTLGARKPEWTELPLPQERLENIPASVVRNPDGSPWLQEGPPNVLDRLLGDVSDDLTAAERAEGLEGLKVRGGEWLSGAENRRGRPPVKRPKLEARPSAEEFLATAESLEGANLEIMLGSIYRNRVTLPAGWSVNRAINEILGRTPPAEVTGTLSGTVVRLRAVTRSGRPIGSRPSKSKFRIFIDIVDDEGRGFTIRHPRNIDWATAKELNRLREAYEVAVKNAGKTALAVGAAEEAEALARLFRKSLDEGAPKAVNESIGANTRLASLQRQLHRAQNLVSAGAARISKAEELLHMSSATKMAAKAREARAIQARRIYTDVLDEFSASLRAQGKAMRERARIGTTRLRDVARQRGPIRAIPQYVRRLGQYFRAGWTLPRSELITLGQKVDLKAVEQSLEQIIARNMKLAPDSKVAVDGAGLNLDLYNQVGEDIWGRILEGASRRKWSQKDRKYKKVPEGPKPRSMSALHEIISRGAAKDNPPIIMSHKRWSEARESLEHLLLQKAHVDFEAKNTQWARTIQNIWRDLTILAPRARGGALLGYFQRQWDDRHTVPFSTTQAKYGVPFSEGMEDIILASENLINRLKRELLEVRTEKSMGNTEWERLLKYADGGIRQRLRTGPARAQEAFLPGTLFDTARRQLLSDTRKDPYAVLQQAERSAQARESLADQILAKFKQDAKELGAPLTPKEVEEIREIILEMSEKVSDQVNRLAASTTLDLADTNLSKPLLALSRMWIGPSTLGSVPPVLQARLFVSARGNLKHSATYAEFSSNMGKATANILGRADSVYTSKPAGELGSLQSIAMTRAHAMGVSALSLAGTIGYAARKIDNLHFGTMTPEVATDINRLFTGEAHLVEDVNAAYNALNRMGMSALVGTSVAADEGRAALVLAIKKSKSLVEVGTDAGSTAFMPRMLIEELDSLIGKVIKSVDAVSLQVAGESIPSKMLQVVNKSYRTHLSLWRASVVTGLIFPNPRYWINNTIGDLGQMALEKGWIFALRRSGVNLPSNIMGHMYFSSGEPTLLHALAKKARIMEASVSRQAKAAESGTLPGIFETMFDPLLGKVFQGYEGSFITQKGRPITYSDVRKWALEDGILEDFVHEELLQTLKFQEEGYLKSGLGRVTKLNQMYSDHASIVQQRQRLGMYVDLLQKGESRAVAKSHTLNALYDWTHAIAKKELAFFGMLSPFYRFARLTFRQTMGAVLEPWMLAPKQAFRNAFTNKSKIKRLQLQLMMTNHASDLIDFDNQKEINDYAMQSESFRRYVMPSHLSMRGTPTIWNMTDEEIRDYEIETGRTVTHATRVLPPLSNVYGVQLAAGMTQATIGMTSALFGDVPVADFFLPDPESLVGDWEARALEPFFDTVHPVLDTAGRALARPFGIDLDYEVGTTGKRLNSTEETAYLQFIRLPWAKNRFQGPDMSTGVPVIPYADYFIWKLFPVLGTQSTRPVAAFNALRQAESLGEGSAEAAAAITGFLEKKYYNPERVMASVLYAQRQQAAKILQEGEARLGEGGPTLRDQEPLDR